jgi:DNA-binding GntR family transcriptional regulator
VTPFPRPLRRSQALYEQTYQALRTAILSGELSAGARLVETQLADMLQVSRTPIREAIRLLQRENLVMTDEAGALRVSVLSVSDAGYLYDCRLALEQVAVVEASRHASRAQLKAIDQAVQQAEKLKTPKSNQLSDYQMLMMDYQFHRLIAEGAGNPWLVSLLDQVFDKMALLRLRTLQHNRRVLEIRGEHRQIYQAIAEGDEAKAIAAVSDHLSASKTRVIYEVQQLEQDTNLAGIADSQ